MKEFLLNMLSNNNNGSISVKRVVGFLGFLFLAVSMFISVLSKRTLTPDPILVDAVTYITMSALFGNTVEKFAKKNNTINVQNTQLPNS